MFDYDCGYACGVVEPYGFVPEAGCPVHDNLIADDAEPTEEELAAWPNCDTPDCEYKACTWAGLGLCHPCSVRCVGKAEIDRRYTTTHPNGEWNGEVFQ